VGALGHYLEREGIPTAQISLIREQTAAIRPPRALWVPFMLGRPFGTPGEAGFQRRVLLALLSLFERPQGPLLEDFPDDAPADQAEPGSFACPVSFAGSSTQEQGLVALLGDEIRQLSSWYELARRRRGRSTVGVFGDTVDVAVVHLTSFLDGQASPPAGISAGTAIKRACDDIRTYYFEAVAAQPGNLSPAAIEQWFWRDTAAARALFAVRDRCLASDDPSLKPLGKLGLIPRAVLERQQS
jgi:hypothetical protein